MKETPSLDDLELFARVGHAGGLAAVAQQTGVSVPTLSRRMRAFERQVGAQVFERGPHGYRLTAQGRALLGETRNLQAEAQRLRRLVATPLAAEVRITAGSWTSAYLARHLPRWWQAEAHWRPVFLEADARLDIARRGADIGVRNHRPDQSWLAGRCTGRVSYACYAVDETVRGFAAVPEHAAVTPSARWIWAHHGAEVSVTAGTPRMLVDLACAGAGRVVLPQFAAAWFPPLRQIGPEIAELSHEEWLVSHHDARHDPPVRAALEAVAAVLTDLNLRPKQD
ncbi:LysR family transcriptional regulator [Epibacterium sp. Ofav1-8]|uniref:LysR family transcriptional regulator n=1 Tax=Epibacterium sp. Ofav1-8 TaxID=2917735 RepID=UPI001EF520BC|nr:LysR family transcriptional regulator [Epibacterium sp. Ofav1-8]MCG7622135.1 LysR family transcriptional regulator [Epibacterium sp. Ofav1-8]